MEPTIRVTLIGFRSHSDTVITFKRYKSNHVKGPNGCGKSDIYKAITWAFFPGKNDKLHPVGTKEAVSVKLEMDNFFIHRHCLPNTLTVKHNNIKYKGDDAETIIGKMFGTKKQWMHSCFLDDHINPFVSALPLQKSIILNEIVGNDEKIKAKIVNMITSTKTEIKNLERTYHKLLDAYKLRYDDCKPSEDAILSQEEEGVLKGKCDEYVAEESKAKKELELLAILISERDKLLENIKKYESYNNETLEDLKKRRDKYMEYMTKKRSYDGTLEVIREYFVIKDDLTIQRYTNDDYVNTLVKEKERVLNKTVCQKINVIYNEIVIKKRIEELDITINFQSLLKQLQDYEALEDKLNNLKKKLGLLNLFCEDIESKLKQMEKNVG